MRFAHLALLFFSIALPMYLMGFNSPLGYLIAAQGDTPFDFAEVLQDIASKMTNLSFAAGVLGVTVGIVILSGFSAVYVVPALILGIIFNYVLIPTSFLISGSCSPAATACISPDIEIIIRLLLNMFVVLAFAEWITGR